MPAFMGSRRVGAARGASASRSVFRRKLLPLILGGLVAIRAVAQEPAARVLRTEVRADGVDVVLAIGEPVQQRATAPNAKPYTRLRLAGCGDDNELGRPALPIISHTLEIAQGAGASVAVEERDFREFQVEVPIYPHQPPAPKNEPLDNRPFMVDEAYYTGARSLSLAKSKDGAPAIRRFRKQGRAYANVLIRPFAYSAKDGRVRYPAEVVIHVSFTPEILPKAAGPRTGTIHVLEVAIGSRADLDRLIADGYDIAAVRENAVKIYATDEEKQQLQRDGFPLREIEPQPRTAPPADGTEAKGLGVYHSYATMTNELHGYAAAYPALCRLQSLGRSVQGREILALKITDNPDTEEDEPEVAYVGTMHGNEVLGLEMCLYFIDWLLANSTANARASNLVNNTEIWIVPCMNPDGLAAGTRYNADGYDLNRSFPEGARNYFGNILYGPAMSTNGRPPEVVRLMQWSAAHSCALAANFHSGTTVVNYPFDNDDLGSVDSPSPDDLLLEYLARLYSSNNPPMWASTQFSNGIVNGAAWYSIDGGMQDWNFRYLGNIEMTIELSGVDLPPQSELPQFWNNNRAAMLAYLEGVHCGVRGIVTDAVSGQPVFAAVRVAGTPRLAFTDPDLGDFHRPLLPGNRTLVVTAPGYEPRWIPNVIVSNGAPVRVDVTLRRAGMEKGGLILTSHDSMRSGALAYKAQKESEGYVVEEAVLSGSGLTAAAVRRRLRNVYFGVGGDYAVILGDTAQIPTFYSSAICSDLPYSLLDSGESFGDYLGRDLMLGRITLETSGAISNYVAKLAAFIANIAAKGNADLTWIAGGSTPSEGASSSEGSMAGRYTWNVVPLPTSL